MTRTLYQITRSLFSSDTLTLFWDKTSELIKDERGRIRFSDSDNLTHLRTAYLAVRAGSAGIVSAGGCMSAVSDPIRRVLGTRKEKEFLEYKLLVLL